MQHLRYEAICGKIRYALAPLRCVFKQGEAYRTFSFMVHDKENGILFSSEPLNSAYFSNPIVLHHYLKDLRERLADQAVALADWQDCITLEKLATWRKRVLPKPGPTMRAATS